MGVRRQEVRANYGDYLAVALQIFRAKFKAKADPKEETKDAREDFGPPKTWLEVSEQLDNPVLKAMILQHIYTYSSKLNLDPKHLGAIIREWRQRNQMFHNQTKLFIEKCDFYSLARQIHRDLKELPNFELPEMVPVYETALKMIRSEYFTVKLEKDPAFWNLNETAYRLQGEKIQEMKKGEAKKRGTTK